MQACAKDTCMGYSKNFKNDPASFIKGPQDAAAIDFIVRHGVYTAPGAITLFNGETGDSFKFFGNPFDDPAVSSVEIVRSVSEKTTNVVYDVYIAKKGQADYAAQTRFSISKSNNAVTQLSATLDRDMKETPMAKSIEQTGSGKYNKKLSPEANLFFNHAFEHSSKKKIGVISLREMREYFKTDKIVRIPDGRFTFPDYGKYKPNMTFIVNDKMPYTEYFGSRQFEPVPSYEYGAVAREFLNIPFDADSDGLHATFGNYRLSKNGKPVLEVCDCEDASHVLVKASWGGPFNKTRGLGYYSENDVMEKYPEIKMYRRASSNGGGTGNDYYVLENTPEMKLYYQNYLDETERKENEKEFEQQFNSYRSKKNYENSQIYKPYVIDSLQELEKRYREIPIFKDYSFDYNEANITYHDDSKRAITVSYKDAISAIERDMSRAKERIAEYNMNKAEYEDWKPRIDNFVKAQGDEIVRGELSSFDSWDKMPEASIYSNHPDEYDDIFRKPIPYTEQGFQDLARAYELIGERRHYKEMREERDTLEQTGIDAGLPSEFVNYNRNRGMTNLSETLYLDEQNREVEPDSLDPKNWNHRHHYASERRFIRFADGYQHWGQILPGDTVVTLHKDYTKAPLVFEMPFVGDDISNETINRIRRWEETAIDRYNPPSIQMDENYRRYIHGSH